MALFDFFMLKGYGGDAYLLKYYSSEGDRIYNHCVSVLIDGGGNRENIQSRYLLDSLHSVGLHIASKIEPILDYVFLTHFHTDHYTGLAALFNGEPYLINKEEKLYSPVTVDTLFLLAEMYVNEACFASLRLDDFHRADLPQLLNCLMAPGPARNIEDVIWGDAVTVPAKDGDIWSEFLRYHRLASKKIDWLVLELRIKAEEYARGSLRTAGSDVVCRLRARQQGIHEQIVAMEEECNILETTSSDTVFPESTLDLAELHDGFNYADFAKCFARDLHEWHKICKDFISAVDAAIEQERLRCVKFLNFHEDGVPGLVVNNVVYPSNGQKILKLFPLYCLNGEECTELCRTSLRKHSLFPFDLNFLCGNPLGERYIPNDNYWSRVFYFPCYDECRKLGKGEILFLADSELNFWRNGDNKLRLDADVPTVCLPHHASGNVRHEFAYHAEKYQFGATVECIRFFRSDGRGSPGWNARPGSEFISLRKKKYFVEIPGQISMNSPIIQKSIYCMTCDNCGDEKDYEKTVLGMSNPQFVGLFFDAGASSCSCGERCPLQGERIKLSP